MGYGRGARAGGSVKPSGTGTIGPPGLTGPAGFQGPDPTVTELSTLALLVSF